VNSFLNNNDLISNYENYREFIEGIFGLSLEFMSRLLIAEKYKKKQPTGFCQLAVKEENR